MQHFAVSFFFIVSVINQTWPWYESWPSWLAGCLIPRTMHWVSFSLIWHYSACVSLCLFLNWTYPDSRGSVCIIKTLLLFWHIRFMAQDASQTNPLECKIAKKCYICHGFDCLPRKLGLFWRPFVYIYIIWWRIKTSFHWYVYRSSKNQAGRKESC